MKMQILLLVLLWPDLVHSTEIGAVEVHGITADAVGWPCRLSEQHVSPDLFDQCPVATCWYKSFAACRAREGHELIRTVATLTVPTVGAAAAFQVSKELTTNRPVCWASALATWCYLQFKNRAWYTKLSDYLDSRADRAAVQECNSQEQVDELLGQLKRLEHKPEDTKAIRSSYNRPTDDAEPTNGSPYGFLAMHAYSSSQSNICSCIKISINIPLPWLSSCSSAESLRKRITALERHRDLKFRLNNN